MCEIKTHFVVLYGYFWYYYIHRLFGVKKVKESAQVKQRNINLFLKAPCVRFFHLELMYCLQDHPEIMPCCSKNAAKSLLIHCQKLPAALSATFFIYTVKNPVAELPGLPIFSVIFTRRLVRGFPTYRTLLEIM